MGKPQCFLCKNTLEQSISPNWDMLDKCSVDCKICGKYEITRLVYAGIDKYLGEDKLHQLSCCIREINEDKDRKPPKIICDKDIDKMFSSVKVPATMLEKAHKIIRYLGKKSDSFSKPIQTDILHDYPIAFARNYTEFDKLLRYLVESGYIEGNSNAAYSVKTPTGENGFSSFNSVSLTMKGWQLYEENEKRQPNSKQCFVAMSFDPELDAIYEQGIKKAIKEAGYEPIRIDKEEHNEKICDRIIAEIRKSRFLVADFTQQKHGVYFEGGFAMGLNIPII